MEASQGLCNGGAFSGSLDSIHPAGKYTRNGRFLLAVIAKSHCTGAPRILQWSSTSCFFKEPLWVLTSSVSPLYLVALKLHTGMAMLSLK